MCGKTVEVDSADQWPLPWHILMDALKTALRVVLAHIRQIKIEIVGGVGGRILLGNFNTLFKKKKTQNGEHHIFISVHIPVFQIIKLIWLNKYKLLIRMKLPQRKAPQKLPRVFSYTLVCDSMKYYNKAVSTFELQAVVIGHITTWGHPKP